MEVKKEKKKLSRKAKLKKSAKNFEKEVKKSMNTAIMAAFGFLIALVWKDVITEFVNKIAAISPFSGKLFTAILVTLICVLGVFIVSRILKIGE